MLKTFSFLWLVIFFITSTASPVIKGEESDFHKNFNIAKQHLSQRRISEALPYLLYLNEKYPENANLKYLIGVCYAELEIINPKTLELLSEASLKASLEYDPNSLEEERVPIYVYYYLSIAHAQNKMCEKAEKFRNTFIEVYPHKDVYYITESERWLEVCSSMSKKPDQTPLPKFPKFKPYVSERKEVVAKSVSIVEEVKPPKALEQYDF